MKPSGRRIMVFRTPDGQGIKGEIFESENGGRMFFSWRKSSEHKFRKLKAWGIDVKIIDKIYSMFDETEKPSTFVIYDEDEQIYYRCDRKTFMSLSTIYHPPDNAPNCDGPQYMLPLREWNTTTLLAARTVDEMKKEKTRKIATLEEYYR